MKSRLLTTTDGLRLEAEYCAPDDAASVGVVLCHPHPQYGGTMRSLVTSELFDALPRLGYACLRFNFRGVEGSEGGWAEGRDEPLDIVAAIDALAVEIAPGTPVALVGWSFGGDMALSVTDERVSAWVGIAPPLRFRATFGAATDPRPKHLVLGAHDEFRPPTEIEADTAGWPATTTEVIPGASHFFVGRTDRVVGATAGFLAKLSS